MKVNSLKKGLIQCTLLCTVLLSSLFIINTEATIRGWLYDQYRIGFYGLGEPGHYGPYQYYFSDLKVYNQWCDTGHYVTVKIYFDGQLKEKNLYSGQWTPQYHSNQGQFNVYFYPDGSQNCYDANMEIWYYD